MGKNEGTAPGPGKPAVPAPRAPGMAPVSMLVFAPFGDDVKQAGPLLRGFRLKACPQCGAVDPPMHDTRRRVVAVGLKPVPPGAPAPGAGDVRQRDEVELLLWRYNCRESAR